MNLDERHPAPWRVDQHCDPDGLFFVSDANNERVMPLEYLDKELADRITLEHNAEWIQRETGWYPVPSELVSGITGQWATLGKETPDKFIYADSPALAIVKAWEWYAANVEGKGGGGR